VKKNSVKNMALCALFAAVLVICSQIAIPMPSGMPLTLQTFAIALCAFMLPFKLSVASVVVWIALGTVGLPVFSNFQGGFGMLAGPTGGFIIGFVPFCVLASIKKTLPFVLVFGFSGLLCCHLIGVLQFSFVMKLSFGHAFLLASAEYILKDAVSITAAYFLAVAIKKRILLFQ